VIDQFAAAVVKKLDVELNNGCDRIAQGRCVSFDDYRYECGVLRGLYAAKEYIQDLAKRAEESDE
jgi:hypothetical protein